MIASKIKARGDNCPASLLPRAIKPRAMAEAGSKKGHSCKPLPTHFLRKGFDYRQIAREHDTAIYERTWRESSEPNVCYEVVRIRRRDGFHIDGRFVGPAEVYPNSEAWGADGFTLTERDAALAKWLVLIGF